jgi:uncharacterized protein YceK
MKKVLLVICFPLLFIGCGTINTQNSTDLSSQGTQVLSPCSDKVVTFGGPGPTGPKAPTDPKGGGGC